MNFRRIRTRGLAAALVAVASLSLLAAASVPSAALAAPQDDDSVARAIIAAQERMRELLEERFSAVALQEEKIARQIAEQLAQVESSTAIAAEAQAVAAALASAAQDVELRVREGQERIRVRPRVRVHRNFSFGGSSAERVLAHAEQLELTEAQEAQIREAQKNHERQAIERRAAMELAELDLGEMKEDMDDADLNAVEAKMLEISRLEVEGDMASLRLRQQVRSILTPEQRTKLEEMGPNVFIYRTGDGGSWNMREGNAFFFGPDHEALLELKEGPQVWTREFNKEFPGTLHLRKECKCEESEEGEHEEGEHEEGGEHEISIRGPKKAPGSSVIAL